jgi:protein-S-isoprenylcysteine O-methyltransferase Ste14
MAEGKAVVVEPAEAGETDKQSFGFRMRGWAGIIFMVPLVTVTMLAQPLLPSNAWAELLVTSIAWLVFVAGALFRFWSTLYVGGRKRRVVVSEGPYSICRNPLYVGSFLLGVSGALFAQSLTLAAGIALTSLVYAMGAVPAEERYLLKRLGDVYQKYLDTVPRYWPDFSLYRTPETIEVNLIGLRIEASRALKWIWLPVIGLVMARLRLEPWWPHLLRLP